MLCTVSQDFREAAEGDGLWREAYEERFPVQIEICEKGAGQGGLDAGGGGCGPVDIREAAATKPTASGGNSSASDENGDGFKGRYKRRLLDPHVSRRLGEVKPSKHGIVVKLWNSRGDRGRGARRDGKGAGGG